MVVVRLSNILAVVALLLVAVGLAGSANWHGVPRDLRALVPAASVPVPPPAGARPSPKTFAPLETVGSSFLHTTIDTYTAPMNDLALYVYYARRLGRLGYSTNGSGTACGRAGCLESFWMFSKGANLHDNVILSVRAEGAGSLFSVAREIIVVPPRPEVSLVPRDVRQAILTVQASYGPPTAVTRTVTARPAILRLRQIVNAMPVFDRAAAAHGCTPYYAGTATVTFVTPYGDYRFQETAECAYVRSVGGVNLTDVSERLWRAAARLAGVPAHE